MTISIWRYCHFLLAVSSFLFIVLASITGAILAVEPILEKSNGYNKASLSTISVSELIPTLQDNYLEILSVEVDANHFVSISALTEELEEEQFYIHPKTGEKLGDIIQTPQFFKTVRSLHRSLFLKKTGRIMIGFTSFILFLIAITGLFLVLRQGKGISALFTKTEKHSSHQYYHTVFGKWNLIFILIITLTGVFLSIERFQLVKAKQINHKIEQSLLTKENQKDVSEFDVFQKITLSEVQKIEFPFSSDVEDYYRLVLNDEEILVNQFNGAILNQEQTNWVSNLNKLSERLHTGAGSIFGALILLLSSLGILYFIYSGFNISFQRVKTSIQNKFTAKNAEIILLFGSENGATKQKVKQLFESLLKENISVFATDLNHYQHFPKAKHIAILTSTYGVGEPPSNANLFLKKWKDNPTLGAHISVVGFGSLAYEKYCQFAFDVQSEIQKTSPSQNIQEIYTINNSSQEAFSSWVNDWSSRFGTSLKLKPAKEKRIKKKEFQVLQNTKAKPETDETFLIELTGKAIQHVKSGDLLAVYPRKNEAKRLYSIGKTNQNTILLSVKRHEFGLCSNFLNCLEEGETLEAVVEKNKEFHFPKKAKEVVMIANGTGIAPFLGMIQNNKKQVTSHLFWGGRTEQSYQLYAPIVKTALAENQLTKVEFAYSREQNLPKTYVQELVKQQPELIASCFDGGGVLLICGSVAMQKDLIELLKQIVETHCKKTYAYYQKKGQILMDCY